MTEVRRVSASRVIDAPAAAIFELIADPANQPLWDGNENLGHADPGQRVHTVGDVFVMHNSNGNVRENHVVAFDEGRVIAWRPSEVGGATPGHEWRWEIKPLSSTSAEVTHVYDWSDLSDEKRLVRARATGPDQLRASLDRLAAVAAG